MFPNLLGQKSYFKLSNEEMANVIGVSREAYEQKIKSGRFTPVECAAYCKHFGRPFEYLFATEDELPSITEDMR